ncbi:MAG: histidine phosphatase family protein [Nannocystaceae bacterium]
MSEAFGLRLYVLRHGEPDDREIFYGFHDVGLSARGLRQAQGQAERLGEIPFAAIYSSDLQRARRGAELVAQRRGLEVRVEQDLREMNLGDLEGLPRDEALRRFPAWAGRSYLDMLDARMPGGGESVRDLAERVLGCIDRVAVAHAGPATAGRWPTVLVYAHNTVSRVLLAMAAGAGVGGYTRFLQRYGAINRIDAPVVALAGSARDSLRVDWDHASVGFTNRDPLA